MTRVYEVTTKSGKVVGLYEQSHNPKFRYVVAVDGQFKTYVNAMNDAYREYNRTVVAVG